MPADHYPCHLCEKPTSHRTGTCRGCRTVDCAECGKPFERRDWEWVSCTACRKVREKKLKGAWAWSEDQSLDEILAELVRLARIGLWAEKHGVPALRIYAAGDYSTCESIGEYHSPMDEESGAAAKAALAALSPKDVESG